MHYDVVIVGAGPAGIFTALEMLNRNSKKKVLLIEKGSPIEKRTCPKAQTTVCVNCKPYCHITTGFSGAGAFSDGKLSLSSEVGGELPELKTHELVQEYIEKTDAMYLHFGADDHVEGLEHPEEIKEIRRNAIKAGLKLVDCPIRHLGTEKAQDIYYKIQQHLIANGIEVRFNTRAEDLTIVDGKIQSIQAKDLKAKDEPYTITGDHFVLATGRKGADWLKQMCLNHSIAHKAGTVDIGVRVEVRNEIMEKVNSVLYESKLIGHVAPYKDKVRTFCQNTGGFVSQENYDNNLAVVNGHSYKEKKSNNTNLAILSSHNFSEPFDQPIQYGKKVSELVNMLGGGKIMVQRYGDILAGKRTWPKELSESNVVPTLKDAVAGDITAAIPYRPMTNIINFIEALNTVVPGFSSTETLLYGPEVKFYSNKVILEENFESSINNLYCLGDSSGWTRGLMMASVMGVMMGEQLA